MDQIDDDIEFDFFEDEPATAEAPPPPARVRLPGRTGRPPRRPAGPPKGAAPLLRLLALVAIAVVVLLGFGLLIKSCASSSQHDAYSHYMDKVDTIAAQSTTNGKELANVLTRPGLSATQIASKLRSLSDQEQQNVDAASSLDPPGHLRPMNTGVVQSLQLRVSGLADLADTFQKTASSTQTSKDAAVLAMQAQQLIASDVVWDNFFYSPTKAELDNEGISGIDVPISHYQQLSSPDLYSAKSFELVLQRIRGASTGGTPSGLHGSALVSVKAEPGGQVLSTTQLNNVKSGTSLAFAVTVEDSGNFQEGQIPVTLTIDRSTAQGGPIVKTKTIQVIDPGNTVTLTFDNLGPGPIPFASQTTLTVDVAPVPGEENKANNSAQYPVYFTLP